MSGKPKMKKDIEKSWTDEITGSITRMYEDAVDKGLVSPQAKINLDKKRREKKGMP